MLGRHGISQSRNQNLEELGMLEWIYQKILTIIRYLMTTADNGRCSSQTELTVDGRILK
jgi:hypothetical protein